MAKAVKFIAAIDDNLGLAKNHKLPWDLPADRKFFIDSISSAPGLMGWGTFKDNRYSPYSTSPRTFVVTRRDISYEGVEVVHDLEKFMSEFSEDLWIIGGGDIYRQLLNWATHLYLTRVEGNFDCDIFFPEFEQQFEIAENSPQITENGTNYRMQLWVPKSK